MISSQYLSSKFSVFSRKKLYHLQVLWLQILLSDSCIFHFCVHYLACRAGWNSQTARNSSKHTRSFLLCVGGSPVFHWWNVWEGLQHFTDGMWGSYLRSIWVLAWWGSIYQNFGVWLSQGPLYNYSLSYTKLFVYTTEIICYFFKFSNLNANLHLLISSLLISCYGLFYFALFLVLI